MAIEDNLTKWNSVLDTFRDAIAIGCDTKVYIVWLKRRKHPLVIKIPEVCHAALCVFCGFKLMAISMKVPEVKLIHPDTTNVAWALSPNAIEEPLLIFSRASLLWIYNPIRKGLASYLRGHGGVSPLYFSPCFVHHCKTVPGYNFTRGSSFSSEPVL